MAVRKITINAVAPIGRGGAPPELQPNLHIASATKYLNSIGKTFDYPPKKCFIRMNNGRKIWVKENANFGRSKLCKVDGTANKVYTKKFSWVYFWAISRFCSSWCALVHLYRFFDQHILWMSRCASFSFWRCSCKHWAPKYRILKRHDWYNNVFNMRQRGQCIRCPQKTLHKKTKFPKRKVVNSNECIGTSFK